MDRELSASFQICVRDAGRVPSNITVSGRHINNNIHLILDLIDYHEFIDDNSLILFIVYYKAFDTIEHPFLFNTLDFLGFSSHFESGILDITVYKRCSSSVKLLNGTTRSFNTERVIKQGDPIAPFLFLLIRQTMALHINKDYFSGIQLAECQLKCCEFADDTTAFLKDEKEIKKTIDSLDTFSLLSDLKVNIKKCELFALKDRPNNLTEVEGICVKDVISYLGIKICKNQEKGVGLNFNPLIEKIKKQKYDMWLLRDFESCHQKVKGYLGWSGQLKRTMLCNSYCQGGLNALDFNTIF